MGSEDARAMRESRTALPGRRHDRKLTGEP